MDTPTILLLPLAGIVFFVGAVAWLRAKRTLHSANQALQRSSEERQRAEEARSEVVRVHRQTEDVNRRTEQIRRETQNERNLAEYARRDAEQTRIETEREKLQVQEAQRNGERLEIEAAQQLERATTARVQAGEAQRTAEQLRAEATQQLARAMAERLQGEETQQIARQLRDEAAQQSGQAMTERLQAEETRRAAEQLLRQAQEERLKAQSDREQAEKLQGEAGRRLQQAHDEQCQADIEGRQKHAQAGKLVEEANQIRQQSEETRQTAEQLFRDAEKEEREAETARQLAEQVLRAAENERRQAEIERQKAEETLAKSQCILESVEQIRRAAEQKHGDTEEIRQTGKGKLPPMTLEIAQEEEQGKDHVIRPPERLEPEHRGPLQEPRRAPHPKPEIVCWQRERQWILAIELPEEISEPDDILILQDQQPLEKESSRDNCWRLRAVSEIVVFADRQELCRSLVGEQNTRYLLFKLTGETQRQGRPVQQPSSGAYLFVVPATWKPDNSSSPESTSLAGYIGYYRVFDKDIQSQLSFDVPGKPQVAVQSKADRFALTGNRLNDASQYLGPLFGGELPIIHALSDEAWSQISTLVVGEEGRGKGKWRRSFKPAVGTDVRLPETEFADRQGGWYFVRFYDNENILVESLDFRFARGLKKIEVNPRTPLPSDTGHMLGTIEFFHNDNCQIQPATDLERELPSESWEQGTRVLVPANPSWDKTKWLVVPKNGEERQQVEVNVQIERIWWAIGEENKPPTEWTDKPATLSRDDFRATSEKILWLLLPRPRWADQVRIGFPQTGLHQCQTRVGESLLAKPLRDFEGAPVLRQAGTHILEAKVESQSIEYDQPLCNVTIQLYCKQCGYPTPDRHLLLEHVTTSHPQDFFIPPTYQDIRAHDSKLPYAIFKCFYCDKYVPIDDPRNKTDLMYSHSKICEEAPKLGGIGPREKHFVPVTDIDEIQHVIGINLSKMRKCKLCDGHLLNKHSAVEEMKHLLEKHENAIYEIR